MKAFLLAAGVGSRLRPITDTTPKCMLAIGGQPLLDIWLDAFDRAGVDEVLVNLHHLPDVVRNHLVARAGSRKPPAVRTVFEPELLGSAGTLAANRAWVGGDEMFLACYADNLTDFDLRSLAETHRAHGAIATLTVFRSDRPSAGGVLELDAAGTVVGFTEKPSQPVSDLANAGMYAFHPRVLDEIAGPPPRDIGYDLLPRLVGRAKAMPVEGYFRDVGTADAYRRAQQEWPPTIGSTSCTTSQAWSTAAGREALWTSALSRASPVLCFFRPVPHRDERGFFCRTFDADVMRAAGLDPAAFVQHSLSRSARGAARGLHVRRGDGEA